MTANTPFGEWKREPTKNQQMVWNFRVGPIPRTLPEAFYIVLIGSIGVSKSVGCSLMEIPITDLGCLVHARGFDQLLAGSVRNRLRCKHISESAEQAS
jgi:hypothetical protein